MEQVFSKPVSSSPFRVVPGTQAKALNFKTSPKENDGSQVTLVVKNPPADAGDLRDVGSISGLGRSPGGGHDSHSSVLTWRTPLTKEPDRLQSVWSQRVRHTEAT